MQEEIPSSGQHWRLLNRILTALETFALDVTAQPDGLGGVQPRLMALPWRQGIQTVLSAISAIK
jgi:hypothetical protein